MRQKINVFVEKWSVFVMGIELFKAFVKINIVYF